MNDDNHKTLQEFAMGEIIKELRAERDALKAELEEKNTELKKWKYVPGVMHCAKCNFQLIKSVLNMHRGTVTAGDSNPELCPNGCGPLWRVSWEKYANDHYEDGVKTFEKLRATEAELEAARKQEPVGSVTVQRWRGIDSMINTDFDAVQNLPDGTYQCYASPVPAQQAAEVTPEMLRAAQLQSELGAIACSEMAGAYGLITELYEVMYKASQKGGENER